MKIAIADPPYPGQSRKHYKDHADYAGEVDHAELAARLERDYDAYALHTASTTLRQVLPLCAPDVRVLAWPKTFGAYKRNVRVAYVWEPIIVKCASRRDGNHVTRDWFAEPITLKRGLSGAKPERLMWWVFMCLGALPGDTLDDLYPGTGAVLDAWHTWQAAGCPRVMQHVHVTNEIIHT